MGTSSLWKIAAARAASAVVDQLDIKTAVGALPIMGY